MNAMSRRVKALEQGQPAELPAELRAWLGQPITDAERAEIDATPRIPWTPPRRKDFPGVSAAMLDWMGAI